MDILFADSLWVVQVEEERQRTQKKPEKSRPTHVRKFDLPEHPYVFLKHQSLIQSFCRVFLFLKLFVVMGSFWLAVGIAIYLLEDWAWHETLGIFEPLSALFIFVIFVCNGRTLAMLHGTFPQFKRTCYFRILYKITA